MNQESDCEYFSYNNTWFFFARQLDFLWKNKSEKNRSKQYVFGHSNGDVRCYGCFDDLRFRVNNESAALRVAWYRGKVESTKRRLISVNDGINDGQRVVCNQAF